MTTPSKITAQKDSDKIDDKGSSSDEVVEVVGFPAHLAEKMPKTLPNTKLGSNSKTPPHKRKSTSRKRQKRNNQSAKKQQEVQD